MNLLIIDDQQRNLTFLTRIISENLPNTNFVNEKAFCLTERENQKISIIQFIQDNVENIDCILIDLCLMLDDHKISDETSEDGTSYLSIESIESLEDVLTNSNISFAFITREGRTNSILNRYQGEHPSWVRLDTPAKELFEPTGGLHFSKNRRVNCQYKKKIGGFDCPREFDATCCNTTRCLVEWLSLQSNVLSKKGDYNEVF